MCSEPGGAWDNQQWKPHVWIQVYRGETRNTKSRALWNWIIMRTVVCYKVWASLNYQVSSQAEKVIWTWESIWSFFGVHGAWNPSLSPYSDLHTRLTHTESLCYIGNNKTFSTLLWYGFLAQCAELSDYFPPAGLSFWLELLSLKSPYGSK